MPSQTLQTIIAINATASGFGQVGNTLTELGSLVSGISNQLIEFGKESTEVYRSYEKSMREAEVALSTTYGRNTKELSRVMDQLNASATEWAATTIFHTDDVANAISEAAHAGWNLDQIITGLPAAMQLAQAGSLDLSEAVNYIVKSTSAAGIEFNDITRFIDLWTFAANSSASTVGEFGDAMLRMGSTMRFAANPEELMTLIAITANAGATGSEAGTMIRNSMMRLIAPTDKANKAMALLGATSTETASMLNDEALSAANASLAAYGFSAFYQDGDKKGQMKSTLDIYRELYVALGEIAGGYDNIGKNEKALNVLSSIFPTRTITEALTLLRGAAEGYDGLYEAMIGGQANNYGAYAATTMMDTLNGKIETFNSKVERLKQVAGKELGGQLEGILGGLGDFVDRIATMDEGQFSAITRALEVIALAGPGLMTAGAAFRFLGAAMSMGGGWGAVAVAAAALTAYLYELDRMDYQDKFGNMDLDQSKVAAYIDGLKEKFEEANKQVANFDKALKDSVDNYKTASTDLSSSLITNMLTGVTIEEGSDEYIRLMGLGGEMVTALRDGIDAHYQEIVASLAGSFGEEGAEDPVWAQIMSIIEQGHAEDVGKASELSQQLRDAMTSAFADGTLTAEEVQNITGIEKQIETLLSQMQDRANYLEKQKILRQARTLGLSAITGTAAQITAARNAEQETLLAQQDAAYYDLSFLYDQAIANGWEIPNLDGTEGTHKATEAEKSAALADLAAKQKSERESWAASFNSFLVDLYETGITESALGQTWADLGEFAQSFREAGGTVTADALNKWKNHTAKDMAEVQTYLNSFVNSLGGMDALEEYADYFERTGNADMAAKYQRIIDMYNLLGGNTLFAPEVGSQGQGIGDYSGQDAYSLIQNLLKGAYGEGGTMTPYSLAKLISDMGGVIGDFEWQSILGDTLWSQFNAQAQQAGMSISEWISNAVRERGMTGENEVDFMTGNRFSFSGQRISEDSVIRRNTRDDGTQEIFGYMTGEQAVDIVASVDGDTDDLHMAIMDENGQELIENVTGDATELEAILDQYKGRIIRVYFQGANLYAEGGRATRASVFGEAGPEWAIPEEHSDRTAELLNMTRAASGFTWSELLERFGGLNANPGSQPTTIVYSPTINANDAEGVEKVLEDDRRRFEKWYEDKRMRDAAEVYT